MPTPPEEELLPTTQAAKAVGVAPRTLQKWVKAGLLEPTIRTAQGGHARWRLTDLEQQLAVLQARRDSW